MKPNYHCLTLCVIHESTAMQACRNEVARDGVTPLMLAAMRGHVAVIHCLLMPGSTRDEHGSRMLTESDGRGWTALLHAQRAGRYESERILLQYARDMGLELINEGYGMTALQMASFFGDVSFIRTALMFALPVEDLHLMK